MKKLFTVLLAGAMLIIVLALSLDKNATNIQKPHQSSQGIKTKMATPYVGNNDFRGYLAYQAQSDPLAGRALQYTGNDGGVDPRVFKAYGNTDALDIVKYVKNAAQNYQGGQVLSDNTSGSGGSGGSGGSTGVNSAAAYNQAIANTQAAVNRLPAQLQSGYGAIDTSTHNALQQLLGDYNDASAANTKAVQGSQRDYIQAKNTARGNAGSTLSGLLRLLGARGAGGSSAYNVAAPQAVTRAATGQLQGLGNDFAQNQDALNTTWGTYNKNYNNSVASVNNQRDLNRQSLEQNISTNKASLLQSLAQLAAQQNIAQGGSGVAQARPYLDQANGLLNGLSTYATSPINYQTQAYNAPSLASYTSNGTTPTYQGQAPQNDYFSPYVGALLGKKQQAFA